MLHHDDPRIEPLRHLDLFRGCSNRELSAVATFAKTSHLAPGDVLCTEGEVSRTTYVIVEGEALVTICGGEVARIGPGSVIGELAVLEGRRRTATVRACGPLTTLELSAREFADLLYAAPGAVRRMLAVLTWRFRHADASRPRGLLPA